MANTNLDTSNLSDLITEFRRMQAKDSITPEALGSILQRIADLLASAGTSETAEIVNTWNAAMLAAAPYIHQLEQTENDRNDVWISASKTNPVSGATSSTEHYIKIPQATTEHAGAMRAQQVTDLNTLRNRYSDTVTPTLNSLTPLLTTIGSINIDDIDSPSSIDTSYGRLLQVKTTGTSPYTDGWLMYLTCHLYTTQILFTHCGLDENGNLIPNTHDEKALHIYKRWRPRTGNSLQWSRWELVGGDGFSEMKENVDKLLGLTSDVAALSAKGQIAVEIVNGVLRVYGSQALADAGYVPYLFRHTRKRNRNRLRSTPNKYGEKSKGWHLFGSIHTVRVIGTVASFSTNQPKELHKEANGYSTDPIYLVHPKTDNDELYIPWGRSIIDIYDERAQQRRMIRLRFAIGYAKPYMHGRNKVNTLNLVSNLAEFSVVYDPRHEVFVLSK